MQAQGKELGRPLAAAEPVLAETAGLEQTKSSTDLEKLPDVQEGEDLKKQATEGSLHFRDGGYGWVCCACGFFTNFSTWGMNSSYAVFLSFYLQHNYFDGASELQFAFVGGLSLSLAMAVGPFSNYISKTYGFRYTMSFGTALVVGGQIAAAFATKIWHLFLSQGVAFGIGMGFIMVSSTPITAQWFDKKRALALGIVGGGSGAGGLLFSNLIRVVIDAHGLKTAFFVNAAISGALLVPCTILLRPLDKPLKVTFDPFQISLFKNPGFISICMWGVFSQLSYTVGIYSIPTYATRGLGLSQKDGSTLQSIMAAGQLVGRPLCGVFLDRIGRINGAALVTLGAGLSCLFVWMFSYSFGVLALFAILTGALSGIFWMSSATLLTEIVGIRSLNSALSMLWITIVLPATGAEAIALSLVKYSENSLHRSGPPAYKISIGFAGAMWVLSATSLTLAKAYKQKQWRIWQKV